MKRAWTLLETVMTLCFITMISAALLFWMYRYIKPDHTPLRIQQENQAHTMLNTLFSNLAGPLFFTSSQHSLIVSFDNQLNANPLLSDLIIGELYHDQDKGLLVLNLWPDPSKSHVVQDTRVLIDHVKKVTFSFYTTTHDLQPSGWQDSWKLEYGRVPACIKVTVIRSDHQKEYELLFAYPLTYLFQEG